MKRKPGPKSAAQLATVTTISVYRPAPPPTLSADEQSHWHAIVQNLPGDFFRAADFALLGAYCQAIALHDKTCRELQGAALVLTADNGRQYPNPLLKIQNTVALQMCTLAAKLRLSPSSRYDAKSAHTAVNRVTMGRKPWETDDIERVLRDES